MSRVIEIISEKEFNDLINNTDLPVLVDFYATWCGPCKMFAPIIHEFSEEIVGKAIVVKVDVDACGALASEYSVESIPTVGVFKNGELKEKPVGLRTKAQLSEMIIKYL